MFPSTNGLNASMCACCSLVIVPDQCKFRLPSSEPQVAQRNLHWSGTITKLQQAHIDAFKPLVEGNIIPQCQKCNRAYRDFWVFDERGRVRGIAKSAVIKKCNEKIKRGIYKILYNESPLN